LLGINKINKEIGKEWIPSDDFSFKFDTFTLERALSELNNYGYIIQKMNFSDVMIVKYGT